MINHDTFRFKTASKHSARLNVSQRCALVVLYGYLLSPLAMQAGLGGWRTVLDVLFWFSVATSALWIVLAHSLASSLARAHLLLIPLYLSTAVDFFLCTTFGARLSSGYVSIMLTDYADASDFLSAYARPLVATSAVLLVAYVPSLVALRGHRKTRSHWSSAVAAGLLLGIYGLVIGRGVREGTTWERSALDLAAHETSVPMGAVFQTALAVKLHEDSSDLRERRAQYSFGASKAPSTNAEVYVWVVGESSRPANWSLFGYERDTTPRLRRTPGIVALPHMLTTAPHTAVAVPSMLSLRPITEWSAVQAEQSIVGAFNEAGFKTYWLSMQDADSWSGIIPQVAAEAKRRRYFDRGYDGMLLDEFRKILKAADRGGKLFIVLHTKGSHFDYTRRYPLEFAQFVTRGDERRSKIVDAYDNSILYTDWFVTEVIDALANHGGETALIYASDHGENLLDDDKQLLGHAIGNAYDLQTAAFMWLSADTRRAHADKVQQAQKHASAQLSLSDLPHSLLDLAGIRAREFDARRSLFSPSFESGPRSYIVRGELRHELKEPTDAR